MWLEQETKGQRGRLKAEWGCPGPFGSVSDTENQDRVQSPTWTHTHTLELQDIHAALPLTPRLFQVNLGPPQKLEDLEPESREYWRLLRKQNIWRHNRLSKNKKL